MRELEKIKKERAEQKAKEVGFFTSQPPFRSRIKVLMNYYRKPNEPRKTRSSESSTSREATPY